MTRPLLFGGTGNENLTFAPYHTHYPKLEEHMVTSGLTSKLNEWNNPLLLGKTFKYKVIYHTTKLVFSSWRALIGC